MESTILDSGCVESVRTTSANRLPAAFEGDIRGAETGASVSVAECVVECAVEKTLDGVHDESETEEDCEAEEGHLEAARARTEVCLILSDVEGQSGAGSVIH